MLFVVELDDQQSCLRQPIGVGTKQDVFRAFDIDFDDQDGSTARDGGNGIGFDAVGCR